MRDAVLDLLFYSFKSYQAIAFTHCQGLRCCTGIACCFVRSGGPHGK